jgi:hypothetical protein
MNPIKTLDELMFPGRANSSFSTSDTRRVQLLLQIGDTSWMTKGPDCDYDKRNMSVVMVATEKLSKWWFQLNHYEPLLNQTYTWLFIASYI